MTGRNVNYLMLVFDVVDQIQLWQPNLHIYMNCLTIDKVCQVELY